MCRTAWPTSAEGLAELSAAAAHALVSFRFLPGKAGGDGQLELRLTRLADRRAGSLQEVPLDIVDTRSPEHCQ